LRDETTGAGDISGVQVRTDPHMLHAVSLPAVWTVDSCINFDFGDQ
jgi:hypothetical protein